MTSEQNKVLVREVFDALNNRDKEAFAARHGDDVVLHDHDDRSVGIDAAVDHEWASYEAFPDNTYTLEQIVAENDLVSSRWKVTGTHRGTFQGLDPTGKQLDFIASGFFRIDDGKVAEVWLHYDRLEIFEQLGVVASPRS